MSFWNFFNKKDVPSYNEALITNIMNASLDAFITVDENSKVLEWSRSAEDIFLYTREEAVGELLTDLIIPRRYVAQHRLGVKNFLKTGESHILRKRIEIIGRDRNDREIPIELTVVPIETNRGFIFTASIRDLTEKKREIENKELLAQELNHRVKNIMSVIQGLAQQSFPKDARSATFVSRIFALSKAHDILFQQDWSGADLNTLVRDATQFYGGNDHFHIQAGVNYRLPATTAVAFALVLHELTTNAVKYGALSVETGYIEITWAKVLGNKIIWAWQEFNGPEVQEPEEKGFGYKLITRSLTGIADVQVDFDPAGLKCTITIDSSKNV